MDKLCSEDEVSTEPKNDGEWRLTTSETASFLEVSAFSSLRNLVTLEGIAPALPSKTSVVQEHELQLETLNR